MKILKFGGSSVGSPERIRKVVQMIQKAYEENPQIGIVVSAFGGGTDQLIALGQMAAKGKDFRAELKGFFARHSEAAKELVPELGAFYQEDFHQLEKALKQIAGELSLKSLDLLMSFGERLSALIISKAVQKVIPNAKFVDARDLIKTDRNFGAAKVDFIRSNEEIRKRLKDLPFVPIIPGFIGSSKENEATTLGRDGSDYSAAIIGAALEVEAIEIWTDVSGIYNADPRKVPDAIPFAQLSYEKAMEMAESGAKVIHPPSIVPAREKKIPIWIKNTFQPEDRGTLISSEKPKQVFLIGAGLIGSSLLDLMRSKNLRLIGLANSRSMVFKPEGIPIEHWKGCLDSDGEEMNLGKFIDKMVDLDEGNAIFVDCTSSQEVADAYEKILDAGIAIATPNKKANSGTYKQYKKLQKKRSSFFYGANVGAGLPMIAAIRDLVEGGDRIHKIEAVLSGSLSYILNRVSDGVSFSEAVQEAQKKGYTEPNPQEDLSGFDVARKLLILCREIGLPLEMEEIDLEPVLEEHLKPNQRYIASWDQGCPKVALQSIGPDHPFFQLQANENILAIYSDFYPESPLIIKGPGAGAKVTAGRVLAEIMRAK
ncbi:MAG: aspartate kinase [Parachlamydiales bacterium]|nr:aspartate kinase [Parachlamydiales bacterium]